MSSDCLHCLSLVKIFLAMKLLENKVVLITGASRGIGKAIAKKFAEEGACVVLNDINQERLDGAVIEFKKLFGSLCCL